MKENSKFKPVKLCLKIDLVSYPARAVGEHGFGLVGFYGISTLVDYLMPKSFLYIYINYIWFGLVVFCGISTIVGCLMQNSFYTYILNIWSSGLEPYNILTASLQRSKTPPACPRYHVKQSDSEAPVLL